MNDYPAEIWLDERVARTQPGQPDENKASQGINQVRYISFDQVRKMVQAARGPAEFFIQVEVDQNDGRVYGLSNYGRLFYLAFSPDDGPVHWVEVETPNFAGGLNDAEMEAGT